MIAASEEMHEEIWMLNEIMANLSIFHFEAVAITHFV